MIGGPVSIDMARVKARADTVSGNARAGVEKWLRGMDRLTVFTGHARFEGPRTIRVGDEVLNAERIFINVGGRARVPEMPGVQEVPYLTNTSLLALNVVPRHLVVVGGSYVGLEFAQMFRRFGAEVTVVEKGPRLVGREDEEISDEVCSILQREGVTVRVNSECISLAPHAQGVAVGVSCTSGEPQVVGSHLLLAIGRRPNTDDLGLDRAGVEVDPHGYVKVDDQLATNVPGIWALGDCNGQGAFTHTAYNDYEIVAANLLDGETRRVTDRIPAYALYSDPPLGRAGLTESEAKSNGRRILVGKRPMTRVGRAVEKDETQGLMKIVVDAGSQEILGAAILGTGGDEAIHSVIDMMAMRASASTLRHTMHIHPTVAELLPTIAGELKPVQ
jgi:pyruvate/2-oxoglutarate dehydrogenase complex dihydrolipoamide dehydrogenase (E3) component